MKMKVFGRSMLVMLALVVAGLVFIHFSPDYNIYLVRSESMKPAINLGDMVVIGPLNKPLNGQVKPGMVVTYEHGKALVTHRVLSVDGDTLVTKGDAMEDPDPRPVTMPQIRGIYLFKIPYIGYLSSFMRTKNGWFLMVVIPAMLLVSLLVKDIVKEALRDEPETVSYSAQRREPVKVSGITQRITDLISDIVKVALRSEPEKVSCSTLRTEPVKATGIIQRITDWYEPWRYRKLITIGNSRGAQTDCKVKVAINTQELISAGKMQPDGDDIRFTKADIVTRIPYWIESGINTPSTIIWVRLPFIPSVGSTIYLYYGNPAAAPASDRTATFMLNGDFEERPGGETLTGWGLSSNNNSTKKEVMLTDR